MNAPEPAAGLRLGDRWELVERLGSGAMGDVWRGKHLALGHEVAIKLLKANAAMSREIVQRFAREARIAAQLRHRHVARVEDFGTTDEGAPWLVMELLRGESLEEALTRCGRLDRATVVTVARHVGAACDVAHAAGIVHRDLKPANCFLVREEDGTAQVKVLDFGVAKAADGLKLTAHGPQLLGTPVYMSPEQTLGPSAIDGRSDLWSLAVMLYELLTGRLPFDAANLHTLLVAISQAPIPPPRTVDPTLPPAIDSWAARALDRDRDRRFQTGRELAEALAASLDAASVPDTLTMPVRLKETAASGPPIAPAMPPQPPSYPSSAPPAYAPSAPPPTYPSSAPPPMYAQPPQPAYTQPLYAQPSYAPPVVGATPAWYPAQQPPPPRTPVAFAVGAAVLVTLALVSVGWALFARPSTDASAPPAAPPAVATSAPAAPAVAPTVAPAVAPAVAPGAPLAPPAAPLAGPAVAPSGRGRRHNRGGELPAWQPPPSGASSRPSSPTQWNPDEP